MSAAKRQPYIAYIDDKAVCTFKHLTSRGAIKIAVDFSLDSEGLLDRRVGLAMGLLLCGIEGRQGRRGWSPMDPLD